MPLVHLDSGSGWTGPLTDCKMVNLSMAKWKITRGFNEILWKIHVNPHWWWNMVKKNHLLVKTCHKLPSNAIKCQWNFIKSDEVPLDSSKSLKKTGISKKKTMQIPRGLQRCRSVQQLAPTCHLAPRERSGFRGLHRKKIPWDLDGFPRPASRGHVK